MSFSGEIKEELSQMSNLKDKEAVYYELIGYLITKNTKVDKKIRYSTESEYNINRLNKLLNNLNIKYNIEMQGKLYVISFSKKTEIKDIEIIDSNICINNIEIKDDKNMKAVIRGAFMGGGFMSEPTSKYHLEINFENETNFEFIKKLLENYNLSIKKLKRNGSISLYIKDGEEISNFLALIGASNSMLKFEEIRVIKDARNNVNRMVNCEVANLNKTVTAATKQIDAIRKLKNSRKFTNLPDELKEIAELRIKNPDASLVELGGMLKEPIGKSGVNYRLNKLIKMSEEL